MAFCRLLSLVAAFLLCASSTVSAQPLRPRIVIGFDTSGSMALDLDGIPTFGDGVQSGCTDSGGGVLCGTDCTAGIDTDCDGEANDSRMYVAKEAVRNMILAWGDVDWSLARFSQNQNARTDCSRVNDLECNTSGPFVTSFGNPQCNTGSTIPGGTCPFDWPSLFPASCRPGNGSNPDLRRFGGGSPTVCINYDGGCGGGDVLVGFPDMGIFAGVDNTYPIFRWLDQAETNFVDTNVLGNFCNHATTGDCELRPSGPTPLAGLLSDIGDYITPIRTADTRSCRPYSVILLTDGGETCSGNPSGAAATLNAAGIRTFVIGLAIAPATRTSLNAIATAGGTDAGAAGGDTAFFADDPTTLSAGLADIVRQSLLFEICNSLDDDCDTLVDEGVLNTCGTCGAVPTESCNGSDDDCDGSTDEGVANACGGCGAVPGETCNSLDDDCDGVIDEGACSCPVPVPEVCDNVDNDCDGTTDEGLMRPCGTDLGACTGGTQTCAAGSWGTCAGSTGPSAEICNGVDDDCDGVIDGLSRPCGDDTGTCAAGSEVCTAGAWGMCMGDAGPGSEVCDNLDNDCDGRTDEGTGGTSCGSSLGECTAGTLSCLAGTLTCTGGVGPSPETCDANDEDCDGATDEGVATMGPCGSTVGECSAGVRTCVAGTFTCVGARGSTPEVCDALDNDCDGAEDEGNPGGGAACGTTTGDCMVGMTVCTGGRLDCSGATGPSAEDCDTRDNDCDGLIDEGNPGGGTACGATDVGACDLGAEACIGGTLSCVGESGPSGELCDGVDNDCDGMIDEGDPEGGGACGDDTGACMSGTFACVAGTLECMGGVGPTMEVCDGVDNDCDGVIDDGIAVGAPCGTATGECVPGVNICRAGGLVCEGSIDPEMETCDNLDNDCDGTIDEGLGLDGICGSEMGVCMEGTAQCLDGRAVCVGEVGPSRESCDCEDNDCDGAIDEDPDLGALCPSGSSCVDCQCALPCVPSEFGFSCPTGRAPRVEDDGACFCVAERCNDAACSTETVERDGETLCEPDSSDLSRCVCKNNECTFPCEGVVCTDGTVCDPRDPAGRCVEDSCRGLGCPGSEVCDADTGECAADPCEGVTCGATEACREGVCIGSCADVECPSGEVCTDGACAADPCSGVSCSSREVCDPADGSCVTDLCEGIRCPAGQVCDSLSGDCGADPCNTLRCPDGEVCAGGECIEDIAPIPDAGVDAAPDAGPPVERTRYLATGAGGCACAVAPGSESGTSDSTAWLLVLAVLGIAGLRRRRLRLRRAHVTAAVAALSLLLVSGCDIDPFCVDCSGPADSGVDGAVDTGVDTGVVDSGPVDTGPEDTGPADTGVEFDGCVPGAIELCNLEDDDCDGTVDEGIDTDTDTENCGACGALCAPIGAFPSCVAGACGIDMCDVGRFDLDGLPDNGCEYRCLPDADDDVLCDLRDNDCDGTVDEDIDLTMDAENCGACGRNCRFAHAAATCTDSACALGDCDMDWFDIDGEPANGCEYSCTAADPATEVCNGRDDDCDGAVDEGDPEGGGACGTDVGACGFGVEECVGGTLACTGGTEPTTETCNDLDDDCDGTVDQGNPEGGRVCGTSEGVCEAGREVCTGGALVCTGAVAGGSETCDGLDNDCDAMVDEGDPDGGGSCGTAVGGCATGLEHCRGGVIACEGATGPVAETCNGVDDNCDGSTDEGDPGGGGSCGSSAGICSFGTRRCTGGSVMCIGGTAADPSESCNGLDDDCDGSVDEGNPGGGASCGTSVGACATGMDRCVGGAIQCIGATAGSAETCNSVDDDCDGSTDEDFGLTSDVNNCLGCGNVCSFPHATPQCTAAGCGIFVCDFGWHDVTAAPGCEYECDFNGAEVCNGVDDDCDGLTDEPADLAPPVGFCLSSGECSGTTASCSGAGGWTCTYSDPDYEATETSCDGRDNDCDSRVDEGFPSIGTSCFRGIGACRTTGTIACVTTSTVACNAAMPPAGSPEACNAEDDDCDGLIDEDLTLSAFPTVSIPRSGGGTVRVMAYEASRPDATSIGDGIVETHACSTPGVMPWTNLTWQEANDACCALNASGTCSGGSEWRLCDAADWQTACEASSGSCNWAYSSSCSSSNVTRCNGEEFDSSGAAGDQDAVTVTRSASFSACYANWGGGDRVYDLSGNVKEWTGTELGAPGSGIHAIRGGAYNNIEPGRTCGFDFTAGDSNFAFPNTGFRCCNY